MRADGCDRRHAARVSAGASSKPSPKLAGDGETAVHPVLVEPVAPVGAAVVRAVHAADLRPATLRRDAGAGVDGMVVGHARDHPPRVDGVAAIERHAERLRRLEPLQQVHVVGHAPRRRRVRRARGSSRPPRRRRRRGSSAGRVEDGLVALVGNGAEDRALGRRSDRRAWPTPGRCGRDDHRVEALCDRRPRWSPARRRRGARCAALGRKADAVAEAARQRLDVPLRAAADHPPAGAVATIRGSRGWRRSGRR